MYYRNIISCGKDRFFERMYVDSDLEKGLVLAENDFDSAVEDLMRIDVNSDHEEEDTQEYEEPDEPTTIPWAVREQERLERERKSQRIGHIITAVFLVVFVTAMLIVIPNAKPHTN